MDREAFEHHLLSPSGRGRLPESGHQAVAGGAACGDMVVFGLRVEDGVIVEAGFEAAGCGAATAAGSAAVTLILDQPILEAARVGVQEISEELGGLSPAKLHAAELACDALHWALGRAAQDVALALPAAPQRMLVAMSGGVDSSVAALLCRRDGHEVVGVTLELWADQDNDAEKSCCSASAVRAARRQAHLLGLPHLTLDLRDEFRAGVVAPFLAAHAQGDTPNPCIRCNGDVRLDAMLDLAARLGAQGLATGHYARLHDDGGGVLLRRAVDERKDQSYMLAGLRSASLARLRFPLGELRKPQVRALAAEFGLLAADKPDSQDLCFLAGTDRPSFLARHGAINVQPGEIVDRQGRVLGQHQGAALYTVGQRRGLSVASEEPLYVLAVDAAANRVVVGPRSQLKTIQVPLGGVRLHRAPDEVTHVKLRYKAQPVRCRLSLDGRRGVLELEEPVDGAAPGQTACLMSDDVVLGMGVIVRSADNVTVCR